MYRSLHSVLYLFCLLCGDVQGLATLDKHSHLNIISSVRASPCSPQGGCLCDLHTNTTESKTIFLIFFTATCICCFLPFHIVHSGSWVPRSFWVGKDQAYMSPSNKYARELLGGLLGYFNAQNHRELFCNTWGIGTQNLCFLSLQDQ